ncbi:MAG TPA: hypothetical protein VFH95_05770 [Candidatus Kapabacteria bacterium]|nr:hypothetical protein [Candidatus Kapabacteria bacterium]
MNYLNNFSTFTAFCNVFLKSGALRGGMLALVAGLTLGASSAMLSSCATQSTAPSSEASLTDAAQAANSRDAADVLAASVGTSSGGAGMVFVDAMTLAQGQTIPDAIVHTLSDTATVHTATVTRSRTWNGYSYSGTWTHTWIYYDANGNPMPKFIKGQTDSVVITSQGQHTITTPRVSLSDSSQGTWTISDLIASPDSATLNGTLTRAGQTTRLASGNTLTHSFTMNWTNDVLAKGLDNDMDMEVAYLLGNASSDFKAVGFKGANFERQVAIVFHGDGTATLTVTRTSGNGTVDTFTIDVKRGIWLRDEHIG